MNSGLRGIITNIYQKCPITHGHITYCDNAHIIPKHVCEGLGVQSFITDINNCILLHCGLHRSFDNFKWTFDVFSCKEINTTLVSIEILESCVDPDKIGMKMRVNTIIIPKNILPFLWVHYMVYLNINYTINKNIKVLIHTYLFSQEFTDMKKYDFIQYITSRQVQRKHLILHAKRADKYKVLINFTSFKQSIWISSDQIDQSLIDQYETYIEHRDDPSFTPSYRLQSSLHPVKKR